MIAVALVISAASLGVLATASERATVPPLQGETGTIYSVAGSGQVARNDPAVPVRRGDGGVAGLAPLDFPTGVAATPDGGFLIVEQYAQRIRRVSPRGVITTAAGNGREGLSGDGGAATRAQLRFPSGVAVLADGAFAIADQYGTRVRLVDPTGRISTLTEIAATGVAGAADGGVLVVQRSTSRVLHVGRSGAARVVAGTGVPGFSGDGGPATMAQLSRPRAVAATRDGGVLIADGSNRVRRVDAAGIISTVAGNGSTATSGDGGPATSAGILRPSSVAETADGGLLIAGPNVIRRVRPDGTILTVAGTGAGNFSGDGGPALAANLWLPGGVVEAAGGGVLVADTFSNRIRFIATAPQRPPRSTGPYLLAISFRRPIQRGEAGGVTHLRATCPPRSVAVRFAVDRPALVTLRVTRAGRRIALLSSRLRAGPHTFRFRVTDPGEHALLLTAKDSAGQAAADQALLSVGRCR